MKINNTFDHKDDVDHNSEQTGIEPIPPFIANQFSHGINVCDIVCVCKIFVRSNIYLFHLHCEQSRLFSW